MISQLNKENSFFFRGNILLYLYIVVFFSEVSVTMTA